VKGFLKRGDETFKNAGSEKWGMICSKMTWCEVKWNEVMIWGEMYIIDLYIM
jgi:hypothetical protein